MTYSFHSFPWYVSSPCGDYFCHHFPIECGLFLRWIPFGITVLLVLTSSLLWSPSTKPHNCATGIFFLVMFQSPLHFIGLTVASSLPLNSFFPSRACPGPLASPLSPRSCFWFCLFPISNESIGALVFQSREPPVSLKHYEWALLRCILVRSDSFRAYLAPGFALTVERGCP